MLLAYTSPSALLTEKMADPAGLETKAAFKVGRAGSGKECPAFLFTPHILCCLHLNGEAYRL